MWSLSLRTLRDRWTLFVGALLSVTLGVALVQSSVVLLAAADRVRPGPATSAKEVHAIRETADGVSSLMGISIVLGLFLTVFIIGSTLAFTVVERRRELARCSGSVAPLVARCAVSSWERACSSGWWAPGSERSSEWWPPRSRSGSCVRWV
ncbi:MAG: hypothetical protein QM747_20490 [Nocardioides sp.]